MMNNPIKKTKKQASLKKSTLKLNPLMTKMMKTTWTPLKANKATISKPALRKQQVN